MKPRRGLLAFALTIVAGCGDSGAPVGPPPNHPNIVLIITDDHRADALGSAGHPELRTPNLDRLADEGVRFSNAFVTTPLCSPSRASIMTGTWAHTHGVVANETNDPPADLPTFATALQAAGYRTAYLGKWHMLRKATPRPGFDDWLSFTGQGDYYRNTYYDNGVWRLSYEYVTDELSRRAAEYIAAAGPEPFLLVVSHKAAHEPFFPAERHRDALAGVDFGPAADPEDDLAAKPDWGGREPRADAAGDIRAYLQCLLAVDEGVGTIINALADKGILDQTAIVYVGDNGYLLGEHGGLWDKRAAYEPSLRVPLLMRYPHLGRRGATNGALVLNVDIAPTLLDLAGVPIPATMQGHSWRGVVDGETGREAFLFEYFHEAGDVPTTIGVRTQDWKLMTYPEDPGYGGELYDLRNDPGELQNLWADPAHANERQRLEDLLDTLKGQTGFRMPGAGG